MKNYYELLEVNPKASKEIIEKAHKVLVKKCHPDLYQGEERVYAERRIKELNEAYRVLSSDFLREQYDLELEKEKQNKNMKKEKNKKNLSNKSKKEKYNNITNQEEKTHKVGTVMSMVDLLKEIFKKRNINGEPRKLKKEDKMAAIITFAIVIILGVILWFIPATNGFIRRLIPFI